MHIDDFDFELPDRLIAQQPLERRESSRMLVVDRAARNFADENFADIGNFLVPGDLLVLNNTKVFPARLFGRSETGAAAEIFLVREIEDDLWETLARPAKRLRPGKKIIFDADLRGEIVEKKADGKTIVQFESAGKFHDVVARIGRTPLPPYIKREAAAADADRERYQTVFAKKRGAIAAPTAGLHFTPELLDKLKDSGIGVAEVTLHVGYGTFEPVRAEDLTQHTVLPEQYEISDEAADAVGRAKSENRRVVAVGTTTTRALESSFTDNGTVARGRSMANLTITPGYEFNVVDALLTNFHLPKSSLLVLVSTFGGHELIMDSYRHAVASGYRFYSYGDCMLIV